MDINLKSAGRREEIDTVLEILRDGEAELRGFFRLGSNDTFLCEMRSAAGTLPTVYKPTRGERPLWDFPSGTLGRREAAAFETARFLDWDFVPATVFRADGPLGPGSFQEYLDLDFERNYFQLREQEPDALRRVAAFDILINNADRKALHVCCDAAGRLRLIDHGVCFHRDWKLRTVIWDFAGEELPPEVIEVLDRLLESMAGFPGKPENPAGRVRSANPDLKPDATTGRAEGGLRAVLAPLLSRAEVDAVETRARTLREENRFPQPGPGLSVPWPIWA